MKRMKKGLSLLLCAIMVLGTVAVGFGGIPSTKASAADAGTNLRVDANGDFRILQVADVQDGGYLTAQVLATVRLAIRKSHPQLIVLTGDNVNANRDNNIYKSEDHYNNQLSKDDTFSTTVDVLVREFVDEYGEHIPFAVTYGNHDTEYNQMTLKAMDDIYKKKGALTLTQSGLTINDTSDYSSVKYGTGYLDVYDTTGTNIVKRVIVLNSGTYMKADGKTGYGKPGYASYEETSVDRINATTGETAYNNIVNAVQSWTSDTSIQCIGFQHIALQQIYQGDSDSTKLLKSVSSGGVAGGPTIINGASISGRYSLSTSNPTVEGKYNEWTGCSARDTMALYKAFAKPNVAGLFYGHDHLNYMMGTTTITENGTAYTLRQGNGGGMWVYEDYAETECIPRISWYTLGDDSYFHRDCKSLIQLSTEGAVYPSDSDGSVKYISDVAMFHGSSFVNAMDNARAAGYTPVTRFYNQSNYYADLNQYGDKDISLSFNSFTPSRPDSSSGDIVDGSSYLCIAYKTTKDPSQAIRDIRADYNTAAANKNYTIDGTSISYTKLTETPANSTANANCGITQSGKNIEITLYYTKNAAAGAPITDLCPIFRDNADCYKYGNTTNFGDYRELQLCTVMETFPKDGKVQLADLNKYLKATSYVYMFLCRYDGVSAGHAEPNNTDVVTAVPETIYLTPAASATTFKYYVNNIIGANGRITLDTSSNTETGKIYFYCPDAASVKVKAATGTSANGDNANAATLSAITVGEANGLNDVTMTAVSGTPDLYSVNVTAGTVGAITAGSSKQIKWVFTYTTHSGVTKTQIAYSTVYSPYTTPVGVGIQSNNKTNASSSTFVSHISWWQGVHGFSTDRTDRNPTKLGEDEPDDNRQLKAKSENLSPMSGTIYRNEINKGPLEYWIKDQKGSDTSGSFWYLNRKDSNSGKWLTTYGTGPVALVNVDTSRFTNLSQIPNLKVGTLVTDMDKTTTRRSFRLFKYDGTCYYGSTTSESDYQNHALEGKSQSDYTDHTCILQANDDFTNAFAGGVNSTTWDYSTGASGLVYNGVFDYSFGAKSTGTNRIVYKSAISGANSDSWSASIGYCPIKVTKIDKSELRGLLNSIVQSASFDGNGGSLINTSSDITPQMKRVLQYISAGYYFLGKPDATSADIKTAYEGLYGYFCNNQFRRMDVTESTVTVEYKCGSKVLRRETALVQNGSNFVATARENVDGYTHVTTEPSKQTGQIADNTTFTFNYTRINYTVHYNLNGGTNASANPSTYNIETATFTLSNPTKTGYTFVGWILSGATFASGSSTIGTTAKIAQGSYGDVTATANWINSNITFGGLGDNIGNSLISAQTDDKNSNGIFKVDENGKINFTPKDMTWHEILNYNVSLKNDSSKTFDVKVYPQTNILYEETSINFIDKESTAKWGDADSTGKYGTHTGYGPVYGYSENYSEWKNYSNGTAKTVTVNETQMYDGSKAWPSFEFTFKGTGFDINATSDINSGFMTATVYKDGNIAMTNGGAYASAAVNFYLDNTAIGTSYQTPVVHIDDLPYGEYTVKGYVIYNPAFDVEYPKLSNACVDSENEVKFSTDENGNKLVDLSAILGDDFANCQYSDFGCSNKNDIQIIEPKLVTGKDSSDIQSKDNAYTVTIDSVRIYNPAGLGDTLTNNDIKAQYTADNELNPDYSLMRAGLFNSKVSVKDIDENIEGSLYTEQGEKGTTDYEKVGPNNEIWLSNGNGIGFTIDSDVNVIHLAMRSPNGKKVTATVSDGVDEKTFVINSATEMYYDIKPTASRTNIGITASSNDENSILSIGSVKIIKKSTSNKAPMRLSASAYQVTQNLVNACAENPLVTTDELTFTVDFGEVGSKEVSVKENRINYELSDGVWVAKVKLTANELAEYFNSLENSSKYALNSNGDITLTATLVDGEWVTEKVDVKTTEIPPVIGKTTVNVKFGEIASTSTLIDGKEFTVEKIDGVWTAKSELTVSALKSLLNNAGIAKKYMLAKEESAAVTAKYIDEKWIVDLVTVDVEKVPAPELTDLEFVVNFGGIAATKYVASKGSLKVEEVGDTYVAADKIGTFKQKSLLKDAGIAGEYELAFNTDAAVKAIYIDGKWKAEEIYISVVKKGTDTPKAENITFEVAFGDLGTTTIKIDKDDFKYEQIDGVWTATVELTVEDLTKLLEEAGLADKYEITDEGLTLVAKNIDGEWVAEKANANATEQKSTEPEEEWNFWKWLLNIIKSIIEFFKQTFNKIVMLIKNI